MAEKTLGSFRHGHFPDVFLDATRDLMTVQLTKAHEGVHRVLEYSSAHGLLLTFMVALANRTLPQCTPANELNGLIKLLHTSEFHVQEGCATFLTLNMAAAAFGKPYADQIQARLPGDYLAATALVSSCLSSPGRKSGLSALTLKNMEFLVHGIGLAALNSRICTNFMDPGSMTVIELRRFLQTEAPSVRICRIRDYLSDTANAEALVTFCSEEVLKLVGNFPLYDHDFMRDYMARYPLEWEDKHRHLDEQMRHTLSDWFSRRQVLDIDDSYRHSLSDVSRWSPLVLISAWERSLGIETGISAAIRNVSQTSLRKHVALVHSVRYSLEDTRRVLVPREIDYPSSALKEISKTAPDAAVRLLYMPLGHDFPDLGIEGDHRAILDIALYRGLRSFKSTVRVDGVALRDAQRLIPASMSCCVLMSLYNYQQLDGDIRNSPHGYLCLPSIRVFYTPASFDMLQYIDAQPGRFLLRHSASFSVGRDWADEAELPGMIEIEELFAGGSRIYFCLADPALLGSYREMLCNHAKVEDRGQSTSDASRRCAIEACYGFDSVLDRSAFGFHYI